tara:strand:+ start:896 stop:2320 length:1425 start_codon:yes stop_codon:yes gene_type:complete
MNTSKVFFIVFLALSVFSCSTKEVDEDNPYAIQIKEVRSYYKALDIQDRLESESIESYILLEATNNGKWYRILTGAEKSIDDIKEFKKSLELIITSDELKIINYQTIQENLDLEFEDHLIERERLQSKKPNVPEKIYDLINKFPDDKNFIVKSFFVTNCPDSLADLGKYGSAYNNIKHDLPRGIYMKSLMKKSNAVAEVIYEDNLFGNRLTIDIIELKDNLDLGFPDDVLVTNQNIADYFAELILETGNYAFEDKLKIKLSSFQKLNGYKVTIQPKRSKEYLRTYFCLVSKDSKYLVFSQSTDKTDNEIIEIIEDLGETDGLNSYDEFHNAFYAIPANCGVEDTFISIYSKKLTNDYTRRRGYAKWSKKMVGHWTTTVNFNGEDNNSWGVSFYDLLDQSNVDLTYNNLYIDSRKSKRNFEIIDVLNKKGVIHTGKYPNELSFPGNRFVVSINNINRGRLTSDKMLTIANCLQLN